MFSAVKSPTRTVIAGLVIAAGSIVMTPAWSQQDEKALTVRPTQPAAPQALGFMVEPLKSSFAINEPIRFRVSGTDKFFLYVYNVDEKGNATLILPNAQQPQNQYNKDRIHEVPNKNVEFAADAAGTERVVFVASRKYVEIDAARGGSFAKLSETALQKQFEAKGLVVRPTATPSADVTVKRVELRIEGAPVAVATTPTPAAAAPQPTQAAPASDAPMPFVSLDRTQYKVGEPMRIAFGSTAKGHVALYVVEPGGKSSLLKKSEVEANRAYIVNATSTDPAGDHQIVAVYSPTEAAIAATLPGASDIVTKGVRLDDGKPAAMAVYRFYVNSK